MSLSLRNLISVLFVATAAVSLGNTSITLDRYNSYTELSKGLLESNTSLVPNLYIILDAFFPKQSVEPVCLPIQFTLDIEGTAEQRNESFLWTDDYIPSFIASILFSYSQSGITLRGFVWDSSCNFVSDVELILNLNSTFNYTDDVVRSALGDLTAELKGYAQAQAVPKIDNDYEGYSLYWSRSDQQVRHLDIIFTIHIIVLNLFLCSFSFASSDYFYKRLYSNIKGKTNPGYSFFWAVVFFSVVWNVGPAWVVLLRLDYRVYCSLAVVITVEFLVALLTKKNAMFPIPGMSCKEDKETEHCHSLHKGVWSSVRTAWSHILQVLSLWSLLITFTFLLFYLTPIIVSLYLDALNAIVKLLFVKAVVLCYVISMSLLFAVDAFSFKRSNAWEHNAASCASFLTVLFFFPILTFIVFLIGGIVFSERSQDSSWTALFAIIPSLFLIWGSWFSHGLLFPKGLKGPPGKTDALNEITKDLEGNTGEASVNRPNSPSEATPLLTHPSPSPVHKDEVSDSLRSKASVF